MCRASTKPEPRSGGATYLKLIEDGSKGSSGCDEGWQLILGVGEGNLAELEGLVEASNSSPAREK